jgi:hypothetical protein
MKNLCVVLVSVLLLAVSQNTNAQEIENDKTNENVNFLQLYDSEMFHWNFDTFGGLKLSYGNDNWNYSTFGVNINNERIRNALLGYSDSAQAYNSFRKNKITGNIVYWSGIVLILGSLIPVFTIDNDKLSTGLYAGMLAGGLTTSIIGIFQFNSAQSNLFNAVNMFNRNKARELNR